MITFIRTISMILVTVVVAKTIHSLIIHKRIFKNGVPILGKIVQQKQYGILFKIYQRVPVIEFEYKGSTKQIEYWKFVFSQRMEAGDHVLIVYWEQCENKIVVIDKLYWLNYVLAIMLLVTFTVIINLAIC